MLSRRKLKKRAARKENPKLAAIITELKKEKKPIWNKVASMLARPRKKVISVDLDKLNRVTKADDVIVVPGKVLGNGHLDHKITLAAFAFSESAREKLAKTDIISISELLERLSATKGINVRIII
jgi:large subunit ribosomal protein L18e